MSRIEDQANYYKNLHLQKRDILAVIHLEDKEDEAFWNLQLQNVFPGLYHFVPYSKSENGNVSSGCEQCLRFRPYLNKDFFICIDSDLRLLRKEEGLTPENYIAQTYTYSWESHYCEAINLQNRFIDKIPDSDFDFVVFLNEFSRIVYRPLLLLVYYRNTAQSNLWNVTKFNSCIPLQPTRIEIANNGKKYLEKIRLNFKFYVDCLLMPEDYSIESLTPENAYLHIQGHKLYNLITHIGALLCSGKRVAFKSEILEKASQTSGYYEIDCVQSDINKILSS